MFGIQSVNDNNGDLRELAEHHIPTIKVTGDLVSFLLQSYPAGWSELDAEKKAKTLPFKAAYYHCAYIPEEGLYRQCYLALKNFDEFKHLAIKD